MHENYLKLSLRFIVYSFELGAYFNNTKNLLALLCSEPQGFGIFLSHNTENLLNHFCSKPLGVGFVKFKSGEEADRAKQHFHYPSDGERKVKLVFAKEIHPSFDDESLSDLEADVSDYLFIYLIIFLMC